MRAAGCDGKYMTNSNVRKKTSEHEEGQILQNIYANCAKKKKREVKIKSQPCG